MPPNLAVSGFHLLGGLDEAFEIELQFLAAVEIGEIGKPPEQVANDDVKLWIRVKLMVKGDARRSQISDGYEFRVLRFGEVSDRERMKRIAENFFLAVVNLLL